MVAPVLTEPPAQADPPSPARVELSLGFLPVVRGSVLGVLAAGTVVVGRGTGLLEGGAGLLFAALLVLLVPTSRELSRRFLLAGCLLLGWVPLLWWVALPVGDTGRVTIGLALLAGALAGWVGLGERPGARALALLPRPRAVDLLLPVVIGLGLVVMQPWLQVKSTTQTLGLLMSGWDNVAHFSMVHMIRRFGVTVDVLAPPAGGAWQFDSYPQGFHAAVATLVEVTAGAVPGDVTAELFDYSRAVVLLVIAAVTMLVAGLCSLPVLRSRPGVAAPVAVFVATVFFLGPAADFTHAGIGNFTVGCALVVAVALLVVTPARAPSPLQFAAIGGAVVGVASNWVLLLALVLPALVALLLPLRRPRWPRSPLRVALSVLVVLAVAGCLVRTAVVISRVRSTVSPLTITSGVVPLNVGMFVAAVLATAGACLMVRRGGLGAVAAGPRARVAALALVPLAGAAVAVALVRYQVDATGEASYYGLKFMSGTLVVLLVVLMVPVAHLLSRRRPRRPGPAAAVRGAAASVVVALSVTQVFGLTFDLSGIGLPAGAPGAVNRVAELRTIEVPPTTAALAGRVEEMRTPLAAAYYVDVPSDRRVNSVLAAQWYLSLTDTWTPWANVVIAGVRFQESGAGATAVARWILASGPDTVVVVRAEYRDSLLADLDRPDLAPRVIGI